MRLVRIDIEHFGSIRQASVAFGPGLNVLHGPNDLGKSTLAEAIRLALLLPSTSTVHESWIPWTGGRKPLVELVFFANGLHWKVRKEFGAGNNAWLHKSSDGAAWDEVARARAVDGKIREILHWGIPEPGGNAPRGLPTSFLATALLSTQSDVNAVLAASLEEDPADSGKQRVADALSALAQDPLFKRLIDETNERYEKAYTAGGKKKTAADGVLKVAADRVRLALLARDEAQKAVTESTGVQGTVSGLVGRRDDAAEKAKAASEALDGLLALQRWATAKREVDQVVKLQREIDQLAAKVEALQGTRSRLATGLDTARGEHTRREAALRQAEEQANAGSGDAAAAEVQERQRLQLAISEAQGRLAAANQRIEASKVVRQRAVAVGAAEAAVAAARARATEADGALAEVKASDAATREALDRLALVERTLDLREALALLARVAEVQGRIVEAEAREAALRGARAGMTVADRSVVAKLRGLAGELAVAQGKLEVGLAVTVEPIGPRDLTVSVDGGSPDDRQGPITVEARSRVDVVLEGIATVRVVAGSVETRAQAAALGARWATEGAPVLAEAAVSTVDELAARVEQAIETDRAVAEAVRTLSALRVELAGLSPERAREREREARAALTGQAEEATDADLAALGTDPRGAIRKRRADLGRRLDQSSAPSLETAAALRIQEAGTAQATLTEAVRIRDEALLAHPDLDESAAMAAAAEATRSVTDSQGALDGLAKAIADRRAALEALLVDARRAVTEAADAVTRASREHTQGIEELAKAEGQLAAQREQLAAIDRAGTEARFAAAAALLTGPGREPTSAEIATATLARDQRARAHDEVVAELHRAQGALEQVGGAVAAERLRDAEEALELAHQHEREVESEYEAWRLLRDTLVEAEAAQASHLGQTLGPLVGERFASLTASRYERIAMTAQLATEGIVAGGQVRPVHRLSVGTRDQLSTLYRLCLAERLQSTLVLDDQLVHSDEVRLDWFRALLREKAKLFQIVVFTCRPGDYVDATIATDAIRAVDLQPVVRQT